MTCDVSHYFAGNGQPNDPLEPDPEKGKLMINIRIEKPGDVSQVRHVNDLAFETPAEANIIDALRQSCPSLLSLVAEDGDRVVGHILFSPAVIDGSGNIIEGMGLAPLAVLPDRQRLRERGCPFVIVLGHPEYYPRFGFELASKHGLSSQWDGVPDEAFMIMIMDYASLKGASGVAKYREEFSEAM
jgi:putative acetyltransferase